MTRFEIGVVVLLAAIWVPGLMQLAEAWSEVEYASHGFLVPLVAIWAATAHRDTLRALPAQPMPGGFLAIAVAAVGYLAALPFRSPALLGVILVATAVIAVLALRGPAWVSTLRFSLVYLVFMIPLPIAWVTPLIVKLQVWVSSVGVWILQSASVPIFREGNVLTLPGDTSLFVAEACSGITSLITLLPIGVFVAYFTEAQLWRRVVLVAAVIPIALLGNLVRVIGTVLLAMHVSVSFATEGPLHEWAGVATYVVGCLVLLGLGAVMRRLWPEEEGGRPA